MLGKVPAEQLGVTLSHEHLLIDATCLYTESEDGAKRKLAEVPVSIENLGELRRDPFLSRDNLRMQNLPVAIEEANYFKRAGGKTIVDCTTIGLSRDVRALREISEATGLNIIAGAGFYIDASHPKYVNEKTDEELAQQIASEITEGADGTDTKCGIIGEIGTGWPITKNEAKVLRAAVYAQQKTGAPLNIHPYASGKHCHELLDILKDASAPLDKVVLSHIDEAGYDPEYTSSLAKRGCYVEFDTFGLEIYFDTWGVHDPSDYERVEGVCELVKRGYASSVLLSQDVYLKICLRKYGGYGFDHILTHIVPMFRRSGLKQEEIDTMLVGNPTRLLAF